MENYNPKLAEYALPLNYQVPKQEKKKSIWEQLEEDAQDATDDGADGDIYGDPNLLGDADDTQEEVEEGDENDSPFEEEGDDDSPFDSDELDDSDIEDIYGTGGALDPDTLKQVASTAVQDANKKLDIC